MIQGIKLQRGGRQTEKNYSGYVLKKGILAEDSGKKSSYTLNYPEGTLPLTLGLKREADSSGSNYCQLTLSCSSGSYVIIPWGMNRWYGNEILYIDLELAFGLDILKANNNKLTITQNSGSGNWVTTTINIVKWLETA